MKKQAGQKTVERFRFERANLKKAEDQARFRELTLPLYDIEVLDPSWPSRVEVVQVHRLIVVHGVVPPTRRERSSVRVRSDGVDQIIVSCVLEGDSIMEVDGRRRVVPPRELQFYDLARTAVHESRGAPSVSLLAPRDMFEDILSDLGPLHGLVLGPLNDMVVEHFEALARFGSSIPEASAAGVARATIELLCGAVRASPAAPSFSSGAPAQVMRQARAYIAAHMTEGEITPEHLAAHCGVSRTRLYEAFAPFGGVSNHIRDSRLRAVRRALLDPRERRKVGDLAYSHGFKSEAHFSRAFGSLFGITPQALRRDVQGEGGGGLKKAVPET
ncbi:MAG: helix-turn-helix transcriptional regulator, partial [Acetobacteraceae bacterium]|nr:helix-turn-helix transcriptional regulator [Acetobacteraceae bacterium]